MFAGFDDRLSLSSCSGLKLAEGFALDDQKEPCMYIFTQTVLKTYSVYAEKDRGGMRVRRIAGVESRT